MQHITRIGGNKKRNKEQERFLGNKNYRENQGKEIIKIRIYTITFQRKEGCKHPRLKKSTK